MKGVTSEPYGDGPGPLPEAVARLAAQDRIAHVRSVPGCPGRTTDWPAWLPRAVVERFTDAGIERPWLHQAAAAEAARAGRHVVLTTGTASGKSLGYLMPILAATTATSPPPAAAATLRQRVRPAGRPATALYLAPTKALAHDQLRAARALGVAGWRVGALDGDADPSAREFARSHAGYVLTNPDMLHWSVLPRHSHWADLLGALQYVVVDESHHYRGIFGAQVAQVLRRLRRLCAEYGAAPTFVLASATGGVEAAARLAGLDAAEVCGIDDDASPRAPVTHVLVRAGDALPEVTARLLADLVAPPDDLQAIAFVPSRRLSEVIALRAQELGRTGDTDPTAIEAYRGGYLPAERRRLEARLSAGALRGVAATTALELGIDVAGMDAVVMAGLPGTVASYRQRAGRAGRRDRSALVLGLGGVDQRDAHLMDHPEVLFGAPVEQVVLDPDNSRVLAGHLAAAAQERPLRLADERWFGPSLRQLADRLAEQDVLRRRGVDDDPVWYWTRADRAVDLVDLRAQGGRAVQIVEDETGRVVGHVDAGAADAAVHPEAVYLHAGEPYLVHELDHEDGLARVSAGSPGWTTQPRSVRSLRVLRSLESRRFGTGMLARGDVEVTSQVVGYLRRDEVTGAVWDENPLDLPVRTLRTRATWWTIDPAVLDELGLSDQQAAGAAHAAEHCAIGLLGLFVPSDRWDVGGLSTVHHADTDALTVFVHDGHPGGAGFSDRGYGVADRWWSATLERLQRCPCEDGCPACVMSPKCGNANQVLDKESARRLLGGLISTRGVSR